MYEYCHPTTGWLLLLIGSSRVRVRLAVMLGTKLKQTKYGKFQQHLDTCSMESSLTGNFVREADHHSQSMSVMPVTYLQA
jgi:hypothetical protein